MALDASGLNYEMKSIVITNLKPIASVVPIAPAPILNAGSKNIPFDRAVTIATIPNIIAVKMIAPAIVSKCGLFCY